MFKFDYAVKLFVKANSCIIDKIDEYYSYVTDGHYVLEMPTASVELIRLTRQSKNKHISISDGGLIKTVDGIKRDATTSLRLLPLIYTTKSIANCSKTGIRLFTDKNNAIGGVKTDYLDPKLAGDIIGAYGTDKISPLVLENGMGFDVILLPVNLGNITLDDIISE